MASAFTPRGLARRLRRSRAATRLCWALLLACLCAGPSGAMTWEFSDNGDTQGWHAHVGPFGTGSTTLPVTARDGVLRVDLTGLDPELIPDVMLVSPALEQPSELFDRIAARVRVVHDRPVRGRMALAWTNDGNRSTPGVDPTPFGTDGPQQDRFTYLGQYVLFSSEWQEMALSGFAADEVTVWRGILADVRLWCTLAEVTGGPPATGIPEALEIDWIQLTGVEEQLQGERPPPATPDATEPVAGLLFAPFVRQPLHFAEGRWLNSYEGPLDVQFGDLDLDGDLDAVVREDFYDRGTGTTGTSYVTALNEGHGSFTRGAWSISREELRTGRSNAGRHLLVDLNGDRYPDLVVGGGAGYAQVWMNDRDGGFAPRYYWEERGLWAAEDADGDGDVDLCLSVRPYEDFWLVWAVNDGDGGIEREVEIPLPDDDNSFWLGVGHIPWVPGLWIAQTSRDHHFALRRGSLDRRLNEFVDGFVMPPPGDGGVHHGGVVTVGDLDGDGDADLVASLDGGLAVAPGAPAPEVLTNVAGLLNNGDGTCTVQPWLPEAVQVHYPRTLVYERRLLQPDWDLDGDGMADLVLVDARGWQYPRLRVMLGRRGGLPALEGEYAVEGRPGLVEAADVDGDGDLDLVLPSTLDSGSLLVYRNLSTERSTAVADDRAAGLPASFRLSPAYPNPFNPSTVIPLALPYPAVVDAAVYDALGQRVRTLTASPLPAGWHELTWDGLDDRGRPAASGVYVCRVGVDGHVRSRTVVRVR